MSLFPLWLSSYPGWVCSLVELVPWLSWCLVKFIPWLSSYPGWVRSPSPLQRYASNCFCHFPFIDFDAKHFITFFDVLVLQCFCQTWLETIRLCLYLDGVSEVAFKYIVEPALKWRAAKDLQMRYQSLNAFQTQTLYRSKRKLFPHSYVGSCSYRLFLSLDILPGARSFRHSSFRPKYKLPGRPRVNSPKAQFARVLKLNLAKRSFRLLMRKY